MNVPHLSMKRISAIIAGFLAVFSSEAQPYGLGPYEPAHFYPGSSAIQGVFDQGGEEVPNPVFLEWASRIVQSSPGAGLDFSQFPPFGYPATNVLGPAMTPRMNDPYDVLPLGRGGSIVVSFDRPIRNGPGYDFAVFENGFDAYFLELAWVEVSSDGIHFVRFPNSSLTPNPVGAFQVPAIDTTEISGLASKYAAGYGTPFDLVDLPEHPDLDRENIRFVKIVDIIGNGSARDSEGRPIYDPFQTELTAGFDLDAIGVLHVPIKLDIQSNTDGQVKLTWSSSARAMWSTKSGAIWTFHDEPIHYQIQRQKADGSWETVKTVAGENGRTTTELEIFPATDRAFFRVVEVPPPGFAP